MHVFYINLDHRQDRRHAMEQQLQDLGIAAERIGAVTPNQLSDDQKRRYCDRSAYSWLAEAELACSASHHKVHRTIVDRQLPLALILEDDAVLSEGLPGVLSIIEGGGMPTDILRLETFLDTGTYSTEPIGWLGGVALRRSFGWVWGAAGYVVSLDAAKVLSEGELLFRSATDRVLFHPRDYFGHGLRVAHTDPGFIVQRDRLEPGNKSDIDVERQSRASERTSALRRIGYGARRILEEEVALGLPKSLALARGKAKKRAVPFAGISLS